MPNGYVDLAKVPNGTGTESDPWNQAQWIALGSGVTYDYYVRGVGPTLSGAVGIQFNAASSVRGWGRNHWVMSHADADPNNWFGITLTGVAACVISGGVISSANAMTFSQNLTFRNMRIRAGSFTPYGFSIACQTGGSAYTFTFEGCLLEMSLGLGIENNGTLAITDSALVLPYEYQWNGNATANHVRCVFSATQTALQNPPVASPINVQTFSNCQFSWVPPTLPAYNAGRDLYRTDLLYPAAGPNAVATPPQPGTPPYAGYATDPWGGTRSGIGFAWFRGSPVRSIFGRDAVVIGQGYPPADGDWRIRRNDTTGNLDFEWYDAAVAQWTYAATITRT